MKTDFVNRNVCLILLLLLFLFLQSFGKVSIDPKSIYVQDKSYYLLDECFDNPKIKSSFNQGYNPEGALSDEINELYKDLIKEEFISLLEEEYNNALTKIKDCEVLNNLFGKIVNENIDELPQLFGFSTYAKQAGTVDNKRFLFKIYYLRYFIYNAGKQLRELENGTIEKIDLNIEDCNTQGSNHLLVPLQINIAHEMIHFLTGFGGGENPECIVHCLTTKCIDSSWAPRLGESGYIDVGKGERGQKTIECHSVPDHDWDRISRKYGIDITKYLGKGDCFCGVDWVNKDKQSANQKSYTRDTNPCENSNSSGVGITKPSDNTDDNYSYFNANKSVVNAFNFPQLSGKDFVFSYYSNIVIYNKYILNDMETLLKNYDPYQLFNDYVHDEFSNNHKVLIVPSGEFLGDEGSVIIKSALERFVGNGGTLLVMAQQYGSHFENLVPVPEGESLAAYGWREDQSCVNGAIYFDSVHPVMSSSVSQGLSAAVDGYFAEYPSTSSVLLKRTKNNEAALISYPYSNGTVILTSLYTDWGYAHSQATSAELYLVRDLITWAQNPRLPVSSYDPVATPNLNFPQDWGKIGGCLASDVV